MREENIDYINSIHDSYIKELQKQDEYIKNVENQQKKFIKYLEDKIKSYKNRDSYMVADILGSYDLNNIELEFLLIILSKYKEIIGE